MKRGIAMEYQKKGYLTSYFKLFHLKDVQKIEIKAHYHEFDKIILFLSGKVNIILKGKLINYFPMILFLHLIIVFITLLSAIQQHMNVLSFILTLII